jgi:rhodanese-related sulfurtransferase
MEPQIMYYEQKLAFEIDAWDLFEDLNRGEKIIIIDARTPDAYALAHIPGAINIPHRTMNPETTAKLQKDFLYVSYCDGIGCNGSTKGALNMARLGFKVKELTGGLDWWKRDGYATEGLEMTEGRRIACGCN